MDSLLTYIVQHIVNHPEEVVVTSIPSEDGQQVNLQLSVHPEDMGIVIGKDGNIARALRNLLKVGALKQQQRVYLDILEASQIESATEA
jgi:predicted RNA-binding protein YlqC (UPF0109 family)